VTEAPDSTGQRDAADDALISLVIRGMVRGAPDDATKQLVEQGFAITKGPITMATPQGTAEAGKLLRVPPGSEKEQEIDKLFDGFLPVNRRLRDVCSAWQTRPDGTPNDHSDAVYDDGISVLMDFVDSSGPDAIAITVETTLEGEIQPCAYVRRDGDVREEPFDPAWMNDFRTEDNRARLGEIFAGLGG